MAAREKGRDEGKVFLPCETRNIIVLSRFFKR